MRDGVTLCCEYNECAHYTRKTVRKLVLQSSTQQVNHQ